MEKNLNICIIESPFSSHKVLGVFCFVLSASIQSTLGLVKMIVALYDELYLVSENNAVLVSLSSLKVKFYGCDVNALHCESFNGSESALFKCCSLRARYRAIPGHCHLGCVGGCVI